MSQALSCPECGGSLPGDAPLGLCPKCLLRGGLSSGVDLNRPGPGTAAYRGPFVAPSPIELAPLFPQLEIVELLGQGGMGAVYKARQPNLDRMVALKILPPEANRDPSFAERFQREARALARLSHPNIVAVYDFGEARTPPYQGGEGGVGLAPMCYFIMEYVDGVNLRQVMRAGQLEPEEALRIVPHVCDALHYAHEEGIVHRDIKPENILLDRKGRVKIADFGLAKLLGPASNVFTLTSPQQVMGTIHYMAPEQMEKPHQVDHRADIYSLGVVLYEMLTGELPLGRFPLPSQRAPVDSRLDNVVLRTLEKEPERRYQRASEVKVAVETIQAGGIRRVPPEVIPVAERVDGAFRPEPRAPASQGEMEHEMNRLTVKAPTAALYLVSFLYVLAGMVGFVVGIFIAATERRGDLPAWAVVLGVGALTVGPLFGGIVYFGARQMSRLQNYEWAILGSIVATLPLLSPGFLVGLLGLWAFITLMRPKVRMAFARQALGRPMISPTPAPTRGSLPFSCKIHGGLNEAKGLLHLQDDALVMEYRIQYLGMASGKTQEARIPLSALESVAARVRWYGSQFVIVPTRLRSLDHVPGLESGEVRLNVARADRDKAEALAARVMAQLNGHRPSAIGYRPEPDFVPPPVENRQPMAESREPKRRGPIRRMVHSFAKAAKNLFVETTVYTPADSFIAETAPPAPAPAPIPAPAPQRPVVEAVSVSDERVRHEMIRLQVRPPAIALTAVAVINFLFWWCVGLGIWIDMNPREREHVWIPLCLGMSVPVLATVIVLLVGARRIRQLRSYGFAWFTTIWASLPFGPAFVFGIPIGFWARRVLRRPEVREAFVRNSLTGGAMFPADRPVRGNLLTVALPILVVFGTIVVMSLVAFSSPRQHPPGVFIYDTWPQAQRRYEHIGEAIRNKDKTWIRNYLRAGGNINQRTAEGKPALAYAAEAGNADMTAYLLAFELADPNVKDNSGCTPLHYAARSGDTETVRTLLEQGVEHPVATPAGVTPLMEAALAGQIEVVQLLLDDVHGAQRPLTPPYSKSYPSLSSENRRRSYINDQTNAKTTALMQAASKGHIEIVQLFLDNGAGVDVVDDKGETALFKAAAGGHTACVGLLLPKTPKNLLDQLNKQGETALTAASWKGSREVTDLLYKAGAVEPPRLTFCRAYQFAMAKRHAEAIPLLEQLAAKDKLPTSEKSWTMEFGGYRYEISVPYLLVHILLADCYDRVGQPSKMEEALKSCRDVWPKSEEAFSLYTWCKEEKAMKWTFKAELSRNEVEKHLENTGRLPLHIRVSYTSQAFPKSGIPHKPESGTKEGVTH